MNKTQSRKPIWTLPWLAEGIAVSGALIFSIQLWIYAHTQLSILDEGAYLLKGYLFVTREYWPFQDYGPWTNHMPLSFLIPGWVQALFGPGLRTGRYFAVGLGIVMLFGVWIIARRMGGRWWAAAAVWLFAFSVPIIKIYSIWASQGLIACMLVWVLVLCLGRDRPLWQLLLGTGLAGLILLTRLNMAPVLPILLAYIFWENGKKIGLWNLAVGALVIIVGHAFFWPGILKLWTKWLPAGLTPYLDAWRSPVGATPNWNPDVDLHGRLKSFLQGLRYHFFALVGTLFTWLRWPQKNKWYSEWRFRASVFLSVLFGVLFALHLWASLGKDYCVFCFRAYLSFFIILGLLLVITSFSSWRPVVKSARRWFSVLAMTALSLGMAYSASLVWGNMLITNRFVRKLLTLQVPRVDGFSLLPGNIPLWGLLSNKFGWAEEEIFYTTTVLLRRLTPALLVLLFGGLLFFFAVKRIRLIQKIPSDSARSLSTNTILIYIVLGTLLSFGIGLTPQEAGCGEDVISAYESGGAHLAEYIPAGSKIYWRGGLSPIPLLYLPDVELYLPQLNDGYSYRLGGDPDELVRYGWWNEELAVRWRQEADVFLVEEWRGGMESEFFDEVSPTQPLLSCQHGSEIHIYIREK